MIVGKISLLGFSVLSIIKRILRLWYSVNKTKMNLQSIADVRHRIIDLFANLQLRGITKLVNRVISKTDNLMR